MWVCVCVCGWVCVGGGCVCVCVSVCVGGWVGVGVRDDVIEPRGKVTEH